MKLMASARKQGLFLAVKDKMTVLARKRGVFMAAERADKKRDTLEAAKKKPGGKPGEFFACYKRNKFIC